MTEQPAILQHWIDGKYTIGAGGNVHVNTDPATGGHSFAVTQGTEADVDQAVQAAVRASDAWRFTDAKQRGRILHRLSMLIRENKQRIATAEVSETGKVDATVLAEIENSADYFEYYAALVHLPAGDVINTKATEHTFTVREPYGVIGVITPWNVPLNQAARACAPALAAGNTVVIKPAETTSASTVILAELAAEAGLPAGVINVVLGKGSVVGEAIVKHNGVRKVAFTGSVGVGRHIGKIAAERVIPLTLELGGKSANIVFADADLDFAAREAVRAFTANAGQVCSAGTRLLVERPVRDRFLAKVVELTTAVQAGVNMGPMITENQQQQVHEYFGIAEREGLTSHIGGQPRLEGEGFYVDPTIYEVEKGQESRLQQEEIFGPVLIAQPFDTESEVIEIANNSPYGLIGAVWTRDISRALRVAHRLDVGQVFINTWSTGAVETPFGGNKYSGYGREKGIESLNHYTQLKCVVVAIGEM